MRKVSKSMLGMQLWWFLACHAWGINIKAEFTCKQTMLPSNGGTFYIGVSSGLRAVLNNAEGKDSVTLDQCSFRNTKCDGYENGGAVYFIAKARLTVTNTEFDNCRSGSGWGGVIWARCEGFQLGGSWPDGGVRIRNCADTFSLVQFTKNNQGNFGNVEMHNNEFRNCHVHEATTLAENVRCGGSGLLIEYSSDIVLNQNIFENCGSYANLEKAAGALLFEYSNVFDKIHFKGCTFTSSGGKGGCVYVSQTVNSFIIENRGTARTKIWGCGGTQVTHPYSLSVNAKSVSLTDFTIGGMDGGYGQISFGAVTGATTLKGCVFETWNTTTLFKTSGSKPDLTLDNCRFTAVTVTGGSLWETSASLVLNACTFNDVTFTTNLFVGRSTSNIWGQTTFQNLKISGNSPGAVLKFEGGTVTVRRVTFQGSNDLSGMVMVTGGTATIEYNTFQNLISTRSGAEPLLKIGQGTVLSSLMECVFDTCTHPVALMRVEVKPGGNKLLLLCSAALRAAHCMHAFASRSHCLARVRLTFGLRPWLAFPHSAP